MPRRLDAVLPISWSVAGGALHRTLRGYKDDPVDAVRVESAAGIAAVLERFLREHERCTAVAAGVEAFTVVTTVPARAERGHEPLLAVVADCASVAGRLRVALVAAGGRGEPRRYRAGRFRAAGSLSGASVLLIDDTWTSGASAQSAAHALKRGGARAVALVVVGRHVNPGGGAPAGQPRSRPPFRWASCVDHCG